MILVGFVISMEEVSHFPLTKALDTNLATQTSKDIKSI